jgi:plastocyanin
MRLFAGSAAVLVLVVATACGGGSAPAPTSTEGGGGVDTSFVPFSPPPPTPGGPAAAADCASVAAASGPVISMEGTHSLNPSDETIKVGDSVTWTNNSSTNHQIAFDAGPKCGFTQIGKSVSIKFDNPGTFTYICKIHPTFMKGTIVVQ